MADKEKDVTITISAKNLTEAEFKKVQKGLGGIGAAAGKTGKKTSALSKTFQSFGKAGPGAMRAVAAGAGVLAGAIGTAAAAVGLLAMRGSELSGVASAFEGLAAAAGQSSKDIVAATGAATQGMVSDVNIMAAANKGLLLGLPITADSMGALSKSAIILGKAMKQDATKSLDDLITALGRSSPLILDNLGLTVKVGEANETYANKLGKTVSQLTEAEKKTAFYEAALTAANAKVAEIGDVQLTLADRFKQTTVFLTNLLDGISIGVTRSPVFSAALGQINTMLGQAFGGDKQALITSVVQGIEKGAFIAVGFGQAAIQAAQMVAQGFGGIKMLVLGVALAFNEVGIAVVEMAATVLETASSLPILGDTYGAAAVNARKFAAAGAESSVSLKQQIADAGAAALGHDTLGQALTRGSELLATVNQAMVDAGQTTTALTATTAENVNVTTQAAAATMTWAERLKETTPFFQEHMKKLEETKETTILFGDETVNQYDRSKSAIAGFVPVVIGLGDTVAAQTGRMTSNFEFFGTKSRSEFQKTADEAEARFKEIEASGTESAEALGELWEKVEEMKRTAQGETEEFTLGSNEAIVQGGTDLLQQLGRKNKAAAIAAALISTFQAVAKSFAAAGWPMGIPMAAGALAAGMAAVNQIRKQKEFRTGTEGLDFENFGSSSSAVFHGMEAVIPQGSGHALGREVASELARMRGRPAEASGDMSGQFNEALGELRGLPRAIERAVRDGVMLAAVR